MEAEMTLVQKINKTLFILWMVLFCPLVFSAPFSFNPMQLSPHPLLSRVTIPQNTSIRPLCPPGLSIQLCLAYMSFPLVQTQSNKIPFPTMFTPFSHKTQDVSLDKRKNLLSKYKWKSYQYSNIDRRLKRLSKTERNREPKDDYYRLHIQEQSEVDSFTQVIQESKVNGKNKSQVGDLRAVKTEEILNLVEKDASPQFEQDSSATPPPINPLQDAPPVFTKFIKEETKEEIKEEIKEEPAVQTPIITKTPLTAIALAYNTTPPKQCSDINSGNTEATSICIECSQGTNNKLQYDAMDALGKLLFNARTSPEIHFNLTLENKIKDKICHGGSIQFIKRNFEQSCGNISFEEYVGEVLICESCKNKIPPALMLSIMSLESDGHCKVKGDDDSSYGLFQINTDYHKKPPPCDPQQKEQIQRAKLAELKNNLQCLENPVANTQKSIEILTKQYGYVNNKSQSSFNCKSSNMSAQQTNKWRKALAGYNGGQTHINNMKDMPKPTAIPEEVWKKMDEWQRIRVQYFFYDKNKAKPEERMRNLAYAETALGSIGNVQNLSLFKSWEEVLGHQIDLSKCN